MTEGIANAIMSCKYWLGFDEITQQDMNIEGTLAEDGLEEDTQYNLEEDN